MTSISGYLPVFVDYRLYWCPFYRGRHAMYNSCIHCQLPWLNVWRVVNWHTVIYGGLLKTRGRLLTDHVFKQPLFGKYLRYFSPDFHSFLYPNVYGSNSFPRHFLGSILAPKWCHELKAPILEISKNRWQNLIFSFLRSWKIEKNGKWKRKTKDWQYSHSASFDSLSFHA